MARKQRLGDPADVYFDTRTKAVLTKTSHNTMASVKDELARVREVIPQAKKDDMVLVLEHFDHDVTKTIQAFTEGGAEDILKEWNMAHNKRKTGNNVGKKSRKRRNKQSTGSPEEDVTVSGSPQEEHIPINNNTEKPNALSTDVRREKPTVVRQDPKPDGKAASDIGPTQQPKKPKSAQPLQISNSQQQHKPQSPPSNTSNQLQDTQSQPRGHPGNDTQRQSQEPGEHPMQAQRQRKSSKEQPPAQASQQIISHSATTAANNKRTSKPIHGKRTGKDETAVRGQRSGQVATQKESPVSISEIGKRERNISESSSVTDPSKIKKTGHTLEKSSKDLQRTVVSLTRHKTLLDAEIEKAEKRLKKAMDDARTSLNSREEELMRLIQEEKRQATSMLEERQHRAFELKQEINRVASKTDKDILELRADIKHFVSERKVDEEIGRSSRFTGNPDALQEAIKQFGEVLTIKNGYTTRRPSITSLTSMDSLSRPTSIIDDHSGQLSRSASTVDGSVKTDTGMPATPTTPTSPDVDMESEVAKMAAKMQRSLQGQRNRGPRNPKQQGNSPRHGQQGNRPGQGQSPSKEGSRQDQRGNRGRQDRGNYQSNQPRVAADDKPHHEGGQRQQGGYHNYRPRSDRPRGEGGRGRDGQQHPQENRNKDRNIRRREQYRRRHEQGGDDSKQGGGVDEKQEGRASQDKTNVPRPDNIPIPRNGPSNPSKKPDVEAPIVNGTTSPDKPKTGAQPYKEEHVKSPAKKENDAPPSVNRNFDTSPQTEALPQRKPREDRSRKKVEEVMKEVVSMNGVTNGEISPVMVNGES